MANYTASARTNYFLVKDLDAFKEALSPFEVQVHGRSEDDRVCILGEDPDGGAWPTHLYNEDADDYEDVDFPGLVAEHLADDEVAIFMEAGAEKLRYVVGQAIAINNKGEIRTIDLTRIYDLARELGSNVTLAEY